MIDALIQKDEFAHLTSPDRIIRLWPPRRIQQWQRTRARGIYRYLATQAVSYALITFAFIKGLSWFQHDANGWHFRLNIDAATILLFVLLLIAGYSLALFTWFATERSYYRYQKTTQDA